MTKKATKPSNRSDEPPLPIERILRSPFEPARRAAPEAVRSFAGLNGLVFEGASSRSRPRVGFESLRLAGSAAWVMSASQPLQIGLPVQSSRVLRRGGRARGVKGRPEPVHFEWNARHYHPVLDVRTARFERRADGKRVVPTDALDALIFGTDNRAMFYPTSYPWHCIGRLESGAGQNVGTGALVGRDLVLTARHVVQDNGPTAMMKFVPAYYAGQSTVGSGVFSWVKSNTYYGGSDLGAWDFALLRLYQPLGDMLGYFGVRTYNDSWDDKPLWDAVGYPSMAPFLNLYPSFMICSIDDADNDGDATELESEDQDNSKGNSGGPLWSVWPDGPYLVGVTSGNEHVDYGPFGDDYQVLNASGKAMVDLVALARLEIDTTIHVRPPDIELSGG